jgi:hypothetical protein
VPRVRATDAILAELHVLYEAGFRLVFFADDNFYPHTLGDIAASRSPEARRTIEDGRNERLELLHRLATELPPDMHFCTQITMEVADDPEFMAAMKRGRIEGALIGIETINEAGLKATNKSFNSTGRSWSASSRPSGETDSITSWARSSSALNPIRQKSGRDDSFRAGLRPRARAVHPDDPVAGHRGFPVDAEGKKHFHDDQARLTTTGSTRSIRGFSITIPISMPSRSWNPWSARGEVSTACLPL